LAPAFASLTATVACAGLVVFAGYLLIGRQERILAPPPPVDHLV
jgi:hypothetical protein